MSWLASWQMQILASILKHQEKQSSSQAPKCGFSLYTPRKGLSVIQNVWFKTNLQSPSETSWTNRGLSPANSMHVTSLQAMGTANQEAYSPLSLLYSPNQICTSETGVTLPTGVNLYHAIIVRSRRVKRSPLGVTKASLIGLLKSHHSIRVLTEFRFRLGVKSRHCDALAHEAAPSLKITIMHFCSKKISQTWLETQSSSKIEISPAKCYLAKSWRRLKWHLMTLKTIQEVHSN